MWSCKNILAQIHIIICNKTLHIIDLKEFQLFYLRFSIRRNSHKTHCVVAINARSDSKMRGNPNGPGLVTRQVVLVHGLILRNGGLRTAVLTVDRIYFLARVHGLVVDPGRLHLSCVFATRPGYMYAFNDFQIHTFLSAFTLAIESVIWEERRGKSSHVVRLSLYIYQPRNFLSQSCFQRDFASKIRFLYITRWLQINSIK